MSYVNPNMLGALGAMGQAIQPGGYYPTNGAATSIQQAIQMQAPQTNDASDDVDNWSINEQLKMFVWFMKMHHEEDIKGFKAMRDIERSVERAEKEELERKQMELKLQIMQRHAAQQQAMNQAQNSYANATSVTTSTTTGTWAATNTVSPYGRVSAAEESEKESWWKKLLK
jgi:hypothetical protein